MHPISQAKMDQHVAATHIVTSSRVPMQEVTGSSMFPFKPLFNMLPSSSVRDQVS